MRADIFLQGDLKTFADLYKSQINILANSKASLDVNSIDAELLRENNISIENYIYNIFKKFLEATFLAEEIYKKILFLLKTYLPEDSCNITSMTILTNSIIIEY